MQDIPNDKEPTMIRMITIAVLAVAASAAASAQTTLAGTWRGETSSGTAIVLQVSVKAAALSGTLTRGEITAALADGKVSKEQFTFKAKFNDQVEGFTGELAGDRLKLWLDRQGPASAVVLTRVKSDRALD
jgi:hypothetical protein